MVEQLTRDLKFKGSNPGTGGKHRKQKKVKKKLSPSPPKKLKSRERLEKVVLCQNSNRMTSTREY